jgi:hypothetical protein
VSLTSARSFFGFSALSLTTGLLTLITVGPMYDRIFGVVGLFTKCPLHSLHIGFLLICIAKGQSFRISLSRLGACVSLSSPYKVLWPDHHQRSLGSCGCRAGLTRPRRTAISLVRSLLGQAVIFPTLVRLCSCPCISVLIHSYSCSPVTGIQVVDRVCHETQAIMGFSFLTWIIRNFFLLYVLAFLRLTVFYSSHGLHQLAPRVESPCPGTRSSRMENERKRWSPLIYQRKGSREYGAYIA